MAATQMRILVLSFYYHPDLSAGSFRTTAFVSALKEFGEKNLSIDVVTTLPNRYSTYSQDAATLESSEQVDIRRIELPSHSSDILGQSFAFATYARKALEIVSDREYDLIYASSSRLLTATLGSYVSRRSGAPLYLDIRDIFVDTIQDITSRIVSGPLTYIFSLVEKYTMRQATVINLVSGGFEEYFRSRYPGKRLSFHMNGIDKEFVNFTTVGRNSSSDKTTILYAGNIGEGQCLHEIIPQLAKTLGDQVVFIVIGDGGRKQLLVDSITEQGVTNVVLQPPISREQLIEEYRAADVLFLHLGNYSAFRKVLPSKVFEYAATGKPVLAGVAGFAATFMEKKVSNSAVFQPTDAIGGASAFAKLDLVDTRRDEFVTEYRRETISKALAEDVVSCVARLGK